MIVIPPIYAIANFAESSEKTLLYIRRLLDAGVRLIQLRAKGLPPEQHLELARQACAFCREEQYNRSSRTLFIINDDPSLCLACGADGVHLGQEDT
ncbi:MAG TPA: thiamine phosphate synthase, partial [Oligoflexia bacterium]|nr:thiamine phosphate synthase [Oligoflexia bacterium]